MQNNFIFFVFTKFQQFFPAIYTLVYLTKQELVHRVQIILTSHVKQYAATNRHCVICLALLHTVGLGVGAVKAQIALGRKVTIPFVQRHAHNRRVSFAY
jgi:hypothetical protein